MGISFTVLWSPDSVDKLYDLFFAGKIFPQFCANIIFEGLFCRVCIWHVPLFSCKAGECRRTSLSFCPHCRGDCTVDSERVIFCVCMWECECGDCSGLFVGSWNRSVRHHWLEVMQTRICQGSSLRLFEWAFCELCSLWDDFES